MNEKLEVIEALKKKGIDPIKLEKELLMMLRSDASSLKIRDSLKKILEGGES